MRHRAPRPLIDLWRLLPRATARLLGQWARPGHVRALVALMVLLGLGTSAYVTAASVMGGSSNTASESAELGERQAPSPSRGAGREDLTRQPTTSDARTPNGSSTEPNRPGAGRRETPSPTTGGTPALRSELGPVTDSPSPADATQSTSPSTASASPSTASATPGDTTPPETSLSEEFPARDAARFSFSANESASFTCSLDGAAYTPCDSPTYYSDLDAGWHTFAVRATDAAGNVDPSPAETRWHAEDGHSDGN